MGTKIGRNAIWLLMLVTVAALFQNCGGGIIDSDDGGGEPYPLPSPVTYVTKDQLCQNGSYAYIIESAGTNYTYLMSENCINASQHIDPSTFEWIDPASTFTFQGKTYEKIP